MASKAREINRALKKNSNIELNRKTYFRLKYFARISDLEKILNHSNSKDSFLLNLFPKNYADIRKNNNTITNTPNLERELLWQLLVIKKYTSHINLFIGKKNEFEIFLFSGQYDEARQVLDAIENEICISDWSIEMKILTTYYGNSYDSFKEFTKNNLFKQFKPNSNEYMFAYLNSLRIEKKLPIHDFDKKFNETIKVVKENSPAYIDFYYYKSNFYNYIENYNEAKLLQNEDSSSIIDRYEMIIFVLNSLFSKIDKRTNEKWIIDVLLELYSLTKDIRLSNLLIFTGYAKNIQITNKDNEYCKLIDLYTNQKYQESLSYSKELLIKYPNLFDLYKIYALSCIYNNSEIEEIFKNPDSIAQNALKNIHQVLLKNEETNNALAELKDQYSILGKLSWSIKCCSFIKNETSTYSNNFKYRLFSSLSDSVIYPNIIRKIIQKETLLAIVNSHLYLINDNIKFLIDCQLKCINKNGISIDHSHYSNFREKIGYAQVLKSLNNFELANDIYDEILCNPTFEKVICIAHNEIKLVHGKMRCLVALGRNNEALTLVTNQILKNKTYATKLKYSSLLESIKDNPDSHIRSNICTPIYLRIFHEEEIVIWGALDNFMLSNNMKHPHEIFTIAKPSNIEKIKFLFLNICTKEVIRNSYLYEDIQEVLEEYIKIHQVLIKLDIENSRKYIERIVEIEVEKNIKTIQHQVNKGKLSVNIQGLKKDPKYNELKKKYEELIKILLYKDVDNIENEKKLTIYSENFSRLCFKIRDIFVLDCDYGFDLYLGTRIRHGWIQGAIRNVFEEKNLITRVDSSTSHYLKNNQWGLLSEVELFQTMMSEFSRNIDSIIKELHERILRIKIKDRHSAALFDYYYDDKEIDFLIKNTTRSISENNNFSFDYFFDKIISSLWEKTHQNIKIVRDYILDTTLCKIQSEIDVLMLKITIFSDYNLELETFNKTLLNSKTEIQNKIKEVNAWFSVSTEIGMEPFNINIPIQACKSILYKQIRIDSHINSELENRYLKGKYLHPFIDILQILFDNAKSHSGLPIDKLFISVNINEHSGILIISVQNNLSQNIDVLERTKEITDLLYIKPDLTKIDNKSGVARIQVLLSKDMQIPNPEINAIPTNGNTIQINLKLNAEHLYYENIIN